MPSWLSCLVYDRAGLLRLTLAHSNNASEDRTKRSRSAGVPFCPSHAIPRNRLLQSATGRLKDACPGSRENVRSGPVRAIERRGWLRL